MVLVKCLYCDADNDPVATSGYCDGCGRKLPPAAEFRGRRHGRHGAGDVDEPVPGLRHRAAEALLTAAVVQLVAGGLFLVVGPVLMEKVPDHFLPNVLLFTVPPMLLFAGLSWWARRQPGAATASALGLYLVVAVALFLLAPTMARAWLPVSGVLVAVLAWALWVGSRPGRATS
jgi:hypothetical protein